MHDAYITVHGRPSHPSMARGGSRDGRACVVAAGVSWWLCMLHDDYVIWLVGQWLVRPIMQAMRRRVFVSVVVDSSSFLIITIFFACTVVY
jgi:hypothetical protein